MSLETPKTCSKVIHNMTFKHIAGGKQKSEYNLELILNCLLCASSGHSAEQDQNMVSRMP